MKSLVLNAFNKPHSRRALLVFHAAAFLPGTDLYRHSGLLLTRTIAEVLDDMGYVVDVADQNVSTGERYDLVVDTKCHLYQGVKRDCPHIFLAVQRADQNERLIARYRALNERRGTSLQPVGLYPPCAPLDTVSKIVVVGNEYTAESWRIAVSRLIVDGVPLFQQVPIVCINNVAYSDIVYVGEKNRESARRNFLFFAGRGPVHKGLDLLLEVFAQHHELELWIAQVRNAAFYQTYWREFEAPNIHLVGWTGISSPQWKMLTRQCAYIIHPSCSEGQAGAVVQCMAAGLIPIVSKASGLDYGTLLENDSIDEIEHACVDLSTFNVPLVKATSEEIRNVAKRDHSQSAVKAQFRRVLDSL